MNFIDKLRIGYKALILSTGNVGKNILNSSPETTLIDNAPEVKVQYTLAEALLNGVVTKEVENLRAQYYMVTDTMANMSIKMTYDANGEPILDEHGVHKYEINNKYSYLKLKKVVGDGQDTQYPIVAQIMNDVYCDKMVFDKLRAMVYKFETSYDEMELKPIRDINKFAYKVIIRDISEKESLLEFYFPNNEWEYESPNNYNLFIKLLKNTNLNTVNSLIGFESFGFVTDENDIGVNSNKVFLFNNPKVHKINTHGNYTIVKYKVEKEIYGLASGFEHITDEMVAKYADHAPREHKNGTGKSNIGL